MKTAHKMKKALLRKKRYMREKHVMASRPDEIVPQKLEVHRQKRNEEGIPLFREGDNGPEPVMEHAGYKTIINNYGKPSLASFRSGYARMIRAKLFTPKKAT